jgi:hypothetical protein
MLLVVVVIAGSCCVVGMLAGKAPPTEQSTPAPAVDAGPPVQEVPCPPSEMERTEAALDSASGCVLRRSPMGCPAWRLALRETRVVCTDRAGKRAVAIVDPNTTSDIANEVCEAVRRAAWAVSVSVQDTTGRGRGGTGLGGRCGHIL